MPAMPTSLRETVIIINGHPGVGKDTFIEQCALILQKNYDIACDSHDIGVANVSTVDQVKTALRLLGYDGMKKTPEVRKLMADLKDISIRLFDGPFQYVVSVTRAIFMAQEHEATIVFVHCREPAEIKRLMEAFKALNIRTKALLIKREVGNIFSNAADQNVMLYPYDIVIDNNADIEALRDKAIGFLANLNLL